MELSAALIRAIELHDTGQLGEAAALLDSILSQSPDHVVALIRRGAIDLAQRRYDTALERFDRALAHDAANSEALSERAGALIGLGRPHDALASAEQAARHGSPTALAWRARALHELGRSGEALAACDALLKSDAYNEIALVTRASALAGFGRHHEAIATADRVLTYYPDSGEALMLRAISRHLIQDLPNAIADFEAALARDLPVPFLRGYALYLALRLCRWDRYDEKVAAVLRGVDAGELATRPYWLLSLPSTPAQQRRLAANTFAHIAPSVREQLPMPAGEKIRLGYVSSDFCSHAISHLIAGLFAAHDRSRFEVIAIAVGGNPLDPVRGYITKRVDRMIDMTNHSDDNIVAAARGLNLHIALDLNVYTGRQPSIFARGIAPVQVSYLGYPGTSGASAYDYFIGDPMLTPPEHAAHFSEQLATLPYTYQPTDFSPYRALSAVSRRELGLPETGFVFCCFNDSFKISPAMFGIWMRLVKAIDGSVLWLLENNAEATANLRCEAEARGVVGNRIIFAPRVPIAQHLARHRAADLFLDTFPYNAHTTASDALWAGLPIVTLMGETVASRVAASVMTAAGITELITQTPEAYEALALSLARDAAALGAVKTKLARKRDRCPLFDTALYTRALEMLLLRMIAARS